MCHVFVEIGLVKTGNRIYEQTVSYWTQDVMHGINFGTQNAHMVQCGYMNKRMNEENQSQSVQIVQLFSKNMKSYQLF